MVCVLRWVRAWAELAGCWGSIAVGWIRISVAKALPVKD